MDDGTNSDKSNDSQQEKYTESDEIVKSTLNDVDDDVSNATGTDEKSKYLYLDNLNLVLTVDDDEDDNQPGDDNESDVNNTDQDVLKNGQNGRTNQVDDQTDTGSNNTQFNIKNANNYYEENINLNNLNLKNNLNKFDNTVIELRSNLSTSCENLNQKNNLSEHVSHSSSLSSSYSNLNTNNHQIKLCNSDEIELKFESLSSIEDNSKSMSNFNQINTNDLSDSTVLVSKAKLCQESSEETGQEDMTNNLNESNSEAYLWTDTEALIKQHEQNGQSACGATAIINVLKGLNFEFDIDNVCSQVKINLRIPESAAAKTTLADYLFSRSIAGMNSHELIQNIEKVTGNKISGRFFSFYPPRDVNFTSWLAYWLRKKAVPVALLNLQKTPVWGFIPDAWHHQMIYACDANNVFLTNPLEVKSTDTIMNELTSESVLLVRCYDVIKRFNANNSNLIELIRLTNLAPGERKPWLDMNVIGQVLSVLRENKCNQDNNLNGIASQNRSSINYDDLFDHANQMQTLETSNMAATADNTNSLSNHSTSTTSQTCASLTVNSGSNLTHICIPASYKSGITLFTYRDSDLFKEIMEANELPIAQK